MTLSAPQIDPSSILSGGGDEGPGSGSAPSQPTAPVANPTPQPAQGPAPTTDSGKPSLFRSVLAGALLGLTQGLGAKTPGAAAAAASSAVINRQQQVTENEQRQQQIENETQQTRNDTTRAQAQSELDHANAALALTQKLQIDKNLTYLDQKNKAEIMNAQAQTLSLFQQSGLQLLGTVADDAQSLTAYTQHLQQSGQLVTEPIAIHNPIDNKVYLFQRDPTKTINKEQAGELSDIYGIKFLVGTPWDTVDRIGTATLAAKSQKYVADTEAGNRLQVAGREGANALAVAQQQGKNSLNVANIETGSREAVAGETLKQNEIDRLTKDNTDLLKLKTDHILADSLGWTPSLIDQQLKANERRLKVLGGPSTSSAGGHKVGDKITQNGHTFNVTSVDDKGNVTAASPID